MDPTVPQSTPILPTPIPIAQPPVPMFPAPNPIPVENPPPQNYAVAQQVINETPKKFSKKWIILGLLLFLVLVALGIFFYFQSKTKQSLFSDGSNTQQTYNPIVVPTNTPLPVTIAPPGTLEWRLQYYRSRRASISEAQSIEKEVGSIFGSIPIPSDIKFEHEEVYKGIPIKWTSGQPIPSGRLAWIKAEIDLLPPFFAVDHPITGVISATVGELKITDALNKSSIEMASAYASGFNIFVTNNLLLDKSGYVPLKEKEAVSILFHEWTHVVQYYETLQIFTEIFLKMPGNATIAMDVTPFVKDFAKSVGWEFSEDQYGDSYIAHLKTDAESQKTSDYGKTAFTEDQAETAAAFLTCQTANYSQARIQWMEKTTNTKADLYCH